MFRDTNGGLRLGECEQWGTPPTSRVEPQDAPSQASRCQASLAPQSVTPTTSSSNESPLDLRLSTLMLRTRPDPLDGKCRGSSSELKKTKIQDIREAFLDACYHDRKERFKPIFRRMQQLEMSGKALVASGIGLIVNDFGAWPELLHSDVKVLCQKWR